MQAFDAARYSYLDEQMRILGIEFKPISELTDDPERDHKLHALDSELMQDIPTRTPGTPVTYETYVQMFLPNPQILHDAYFIALHNGEYIGMTSLWNVPASEGDLLQSLTAVKRSYRRRGIALALKVRGIQYAREHGYKQIRTWNDHPNVGMIAINDRLGFVRQKAHYEYVKEF